MVDHQKCEVILVRPRRLEACKGMTAIVGRSHAGRGGGIDVTMMVNIETGEYTRESWAIYSGNYTKKGVLMNFCPICGAELMDLFSDKKPLVAAEISDG